METISINDMVQLTNTSFEVSITYFTRTKKVIFYVHEDDIKFITTSDEYEELFGYDYRLMKPLCELINQFYFYHKIQIPTTIIIE